MKKFIKNYSVLTVVMVLCIALYILALSRHYYTPKVPAEVSPTLTTSQETAPALVRQATKNTNQLFGLPTDSFDVVQDRVHYGETFAEILQDQQVDYALIHEIATRHRETFDVSRIRQGKPYTLFKTKNDSAPQVRYMVYQANAIEYYVIALGDSVQVKRHRKKVEMKARQVSGSIESSLYEAMLKQGGSIELAMRLSDIYAWTIDFFRLQDGDYFKVLYREKFIDDTVSVGVADIQAVEFGHGGKSFYGFHYTADSLFNEYYDEEGENLRRAFLKAPLKFSRISSRYSPRRYHPVLKRVRAHLGTDYAAPRGTPIMSTADGTVIAASYTRGNGNYVKVRHNSTYTTQYLHMTRIAKGIRKGTVVKQGEVLGYVGSTGLATGPHVCYRFWKNGKQVDPYKQDLPAAEPIAEKWREDFSAIKDSLMPLLQQMPLAPLKGEA